MSVSKIAIEKFISAYSEALSRGDARQISGLWAIPSLVIDQSATISVTDQAQVEAFFQKAVAHYTGQGIAVAEGQLESFKNISDFVSGVTITWLMRDGQGQEKGRETMYYILQADEKGELLVRVSVAE